MTLYWKNGKVAVTDGPYAKTKEQLGGILELEACRSESRRSAYLAASRSEVWTLGDTSCCESERHDSGERTPPRKGHRKMSILGMQLRRDDKRSSGGMPLRVPRDRCGIRHLAYNLCGVCPTECRRLPGPSVPPSRREKRQSPSTADRIREDRLDERLLARP